MVDKPLNQIKPNSSIATSIKCKRKKEKGIRTKV